MQLDTIQPTQKIYWQIYWNEVYTLTHYAMEYTEHIHKSGKDYYQTLNSRKCLANIKTKSNRSILHQTKLLWFIDFQPPV